MKQIAAALLCALLCVQPVYAVQIREPILYTDTQKESDTQGEGMEESGAEEQDPKERTGGVEVSAPSAILMEASTGQVIYDKDADEKRPPASVTKVMTLLLIFDALNDGKIKPEDEVVTSEYAASMGGSQVFLEPGEIQTVDTLIKCISVASANDACVALKKRKPINSSASISCAALIAEYPTVWRYVRSFRPPGWQRYHPPMYWQTGR